MSRALVGYYAHHQGRGHLHRALTLARLLQARDVDVVVLSSLAPSSDDGGPPVRTLRLDRDDERAGGAHDVTAGGLLHWVPRHDPGLRARSAQLSRWIDAERPDLIVSDVSQEVALLCRLHGVPVISVVLPGERGDAAHRLGLGVSEALVGFWPPSATRMVSGLPAEPADRLRAVGALSRYAPQPRIRSTRPSRHLVVLAGRGGDAWSHAQLHAIAAAAPGWSVEPVGGEHWTSDPWSRLQRADVVLTRAGQASVAEVAASRTPAIVVPAPRPHAEQAHTAAQLAAGPWPVRVIDRVPQEGFERLLDQVATLPGEGWTSWCDGTAGDRFADIVDAALSRATPVST